MANSMAPVYIKPTVAFNRGDSFVFGAWVCIADGVGSFQRRLTMPPNPETGFDTSRSSHGRTRRQVRQNFAFRPTR
jgi:hypothetical protein